MAAAAVKTVCIVGAGPAGLVAAKTFVQHGNFVVTVYEAADRVGGMWRGKLGEHGDKCSPDMRTNGSKFTIAFADLSWSSVDLSDPETGPSPVFPKASQVGQYLEAYKKKFGLDSNILLKKRVIKARVLADFRTWQIVTEDTVTKIQSKAYFDHLIIASGFFDKPGRSFAPDPDSRSRNIQHSSQFRNISSLTDETGKIAVIGAGISGSEAAAQIAFQISSAKNSPGEKPIHANSRVYHVLNRPFYSIPRYLPQNPENPELQDSNLAPSFLPNDLVLFNLSRRGEGKISAAITPVPPEKAQKGHEFMRSVLGGDQRELGHSVLVYKPELTQHPGYVGITDTYAEFVRSGIIVPVQGWADEVKKKEDSSLFDITLKQYEPWYHASTKAATGSSTITNVAGIVEATGYKVSLDYLDERVRHFLHHDSSCSRIPFLLTRGSILPEMLPTMGFVGFYEGPYWGVMEMQARIIYELWANNDTRVGYLPQRELYQHHVTERMRHHIQDGSSLQIPQFWMADYLGLVEELARESGAKRNDSGFGGQAGPIFPSRYQGTGTDSEAAIVVKEVADMVKAASEDAKFVATAVFRGMQGIWNLQRKIDSRNAASPGGVFTGTAHFHPRTPTSPSYSAEYLYIEEGTFKMDTGFSFPATRRYIYRYKESTDKITAWFADEDGESVGTLFNTWNFYAPDDAYHGWMAKGHHWCDPDTYKNTCEFRFRGASLTTFGITYQVEGPKKDYEHESWYERPVAEYK